MRRVKRWELAQNGSGRREANRLRRKELDRPFPVSPPGQAGAGGFPPRREHAAGQPKALARIDASGSPHKRGCRPLVYPPHSGDLI